MADATDRPDEAALLAAVATHPASPAFAELVRRYAPMVYGTCRRLILVRHYLEGRSQSRLATDYGQSQPTISRRLDEARESLRARLLRRGVAVAALALASGLASAAESAPPAALVERWSALRPARSPLPMITLVGVAVIAAIVGAVWSHRSRAPVSPPPAPSSSAMPSPSVRTFEESMPPVPEPEPDAIRITAIVPELQVRDIGATTRYYRESLGFMLDFAFSSTFDADSESVLRDPRCEFVGVSRDHQRLYLAKTAAPVPQSLYIGVMVQYPIDPFFANLADGGAIVVEPPDDGPVEDRGSTLADPDGNRLRFGMAGDRPVNHHGPVAQLWGFTLELPVPAVAAAQRWYCDRMGSPRASSTATRTPRSSATACRSSSVAACPPAAARPSTSPMRPTSTATAASCAPPASRSPPTSRTSSGACANSKRSTATGSSTGSGRGSTIDGGVHRHSRRVTARIARHSDVALPRASCR